MAEQTVKLNLDTREFDKGISKATAAISALATGAVAAAIVNTTARFQDLQTTLGTVFGSAQKGSQAFAAIEKIATKTQFGVEDLSTTFIKLAAAGIQPTEKLIKTFTDASAVTTDQLGTLTSITDLYTRALNSQMIELTDLERLADRGLPVYDILKEKLGLARGELTEFSKTAGGAQKILDALQSGIEERFGGATEARLKNLSVAMSNFSIAISSTANSIGSQFNTQLTGMINTITDAINNNQHLAETIGSVLGAAVNGVQYLFGLMAENINKVASVAVGLTVAMGTRGLAGAIKATTLAIRAMTLAMARNPLGILLVAVSTLIAYLSFENGLGRSLKQVQAAMDYMGSVFAKVGTYINNVFNKVIKYVTDGFYAALDALIDFYNGAADMVPFLERFEGNARDLTGAVKELASDALDYATEKADAFTDAIIASIPPEVLEQYDGLKKAIKEAGKAYDETVKKASTASKGDGAIPTIPGVSAGGVNLPTVTAKETEELSKKYDQLVESLMSEEEALNHHYNKQLSMLHSYYNTGQLSSEKYFAIIEQMYTKHQNKLAEINKRSNDQISQSIIKGNFNIKDMEGKTAKDRIEIAKTVGGEVLGVMAQQNKKAFQLQKALAVAQALLDAKSIIMSFAKFGSTFGPIGAALGVAAGVAFTAAQIAAIQSQQYQGRKTGGLVQKGSQYVVGESGPEAFIPNRTGTIIPNGNMDSTKQVNVNFSIQALDSAGVDDLLLERRGLITNIIREATEANGRRSMV